MAGGHVTAKQPIWIKLSSKAAEIMLISFTA